MKIRKPSIAFTASASVFLAILLHEGFSEKAYTPVKGDVPTIGFGTTTNVKIGDTITVQRALKTAYDDLNKFEQGIMSCVKVPVSQGEYDAFLSLSYNIGTSAFCKSTLVRKLNAFDYDGACKEILRWDKFQGKVLAGLTKRRKAEFDLCMSK